MKVQLGFAIDGVSLQASFEVAPQGEALASVSRLTPEERESVFCEAWGQLYPEVTAQLNASLQRLAGEILQKFSLSCLESALLCERGEVKDSA